MQKNPTDFKPDMVLENLAEKGFIVKSNVIDKARSCKNTNLSSSYYKQQPSYFESSESQMEALLVSLSPCGIKLLHVLRAPKADGELFLH